MTAADADARGVLGVIPRVLLLRGRPVFRTRFRNAVQWRGGHEQHGREQGEERSVQHAGRVATSEGGRQVTPVRVHTAQQRDDYPSALGGARSPLSNAA